MRTCKLFAPKVIKVSSALEVFCWIFLVSWLLFLSQHLCFIFFHSTDFFMSIFVYVSYFIIIILLFINFGCNIFFIASSSQHCALRRPVFSFICFITSCSFLLVVVFVYFCAACCCYLARKCALIALVACSKPPPPPRSAPKRRLSVLWLRGSLRLAVEMRSLAQQQQ